MAATNAAFDNLNSIQFNSATPSGTTGNNNQPMTLDGTSGLYPMPGGCDSLSLTVNCGQGPQYMGGNDNSYTDSNGNMPLAGYGGSSGDSTNTPATPCNDPYVCAPSATQDSCAGLYPECNPNDPSGYTAPAYDPNTGIGGPSSDAFGNSSGTDPNWTDPNTTGDIPGCDVDPNCI
jgi:hypothetical protein